MAEGFLARLYALRALTVFIGFGLLLVCLASGAWAETADSADAGDGAVRPAASAKPGILRLSQERISKEIDGWLNVLLDDDGSVVRILSENLAWRLAVGSQHRPDPDGYIFSLRPAAMPVSDRSCGIGEVCPSGYSVSASSREVTLEPLRELKDAMGNTLYRQTAKVVLPFDAAWVTFLDDFRAAVADACRTAFRAERAAGRDLDALRDGYLDPDLTFPLKAAVFSGGRIAQTDLVVHLRCWGSGFSH